MAAGLSAGAYTMIRTQSPGWKPLSTKAVVLIPFAIVSVTFAAVVELLVQLGQRRGGFGLSTSAGGISTLTTISFHYLPTVIAVFYGLWWTWVELDVRRLQPWLELSRIKGATGKYSLLLDYPSDFILNVVTKSARMRYAVPMLSDATDKS
jgi:hypothetical protein